MTISTSVSPKPLSVLDMKTMNTVLQRRLAALAVTLSLTLLTSPPSALGQISDGYLGQTAHRTPLGVHSPASDSVVRMPATDQAVNSWVDVMPATFVSDSAADASQADVYTLDELRTEMKDLAWSKGDHKIIPYGSLRGSTLYTTSRTSPGAYTLFVFSPDDEGEDTFEVDTRRTRVGLDVEGPTICMFSNRVKTGGKLEVDFHGNFVIENKPGLLLRHAYADMKTDDWRILAGQTWDVCSPLNPGVLNYSVGWSAGNIGYRRAQIRLERYLHLTQSTDLTLQGSINQDIVSDFRASSVIAPESTDWPVVQGRVSLTSRDLLRGGPMTIGVAGHLGQQGFDIKPVGPLPARDDWLVTTWSFNCDIRMPLTERFGLQGEFFTGKDLATELGGILQGVRLDSATNTLAGIQSTGGWVEAWYYWTPCLHSHFGYSIDDPRDNEIVAGGRTKNDFYFGNLVLDVTKQLIVGFEVSSWKTDYNGKTPGEAVVCEFRGMYNF